MPAVLRTSGADFEVEAFIRDTPWRLGQVFRRGEPRLPVGRPDGLKNARSGLNVSVSEADFGDLAAQASDAVRFLEAHEVELKRLADFPGVEGIEIDFGIAMRDALVQTNTFAAELVALAGRSGIALTLSHYPVSDDDAVV